MKRLTRKSRGALLAMGLAGGTLAFVLWAVTTTAGSRWVLTALVPRSGINFSAQKIEGQISDHLLLTAVRITLAQQQLEIDSLELRWKPLLLLKGRIAVAELTLNGMRIQDDAFRDNKAPQPAWPHVSAGVRRLAGRIAQLRVTNFSYRHLQEEAVRVTSLAGSVTWQDALLSIADLQAIAPAGQIDGAVAVGFQPPSLSAAVKVADLNLAAVLQVPTDLSGTLTFTGTLDNYAGDFNLSNQGPGWQAASLAATYQGSRTGLKLALLHARLLDGNLGGDLEMDWRNGLVLSGAILGRNLNPARIDRAWQGVVNFTATGKVARVGKTPLSGNISAVLFESRLHGQALTGELQADFAANNLVINRLALHGKGFDLHAAGELKQRLTLSAQISDFSRLLPHASGSVQAAGWLRWRDGELSGVLAGTGSKLAYAGTQVGAVNLNARLEQSTAYPFDVAATLQDVVCGGYRLKAVTVAVNGTLARHTATATLRSATAEARLDLAAGYSAALWQGEITHLAGRDGNGPWKLAAPATFAVSAGKFFLSPLVLTAGATERLEVAVDLALNPPDGLLRVQWSGINLARLKPWLPAGTDLEGLLRGEMKGILLPGQRFALEGQAVLAGGGALHQETPDGQQSRLLLTSATADWKWQGEVLSGNLSIDMAAQGEAQADFQLPLPARFPVVVQRQGPLRGTLSGKFQEKGMMTVFFPGLIQESSGELDAKFVLSGSWEVPVIGGKLRLSKAGAYLPSVGIHLKEIALDARFEKNLIHIDSFRALSGPGYIEGSALLTLAGWQIMSYQGNIHGENFQTVYLPELQIYSTLELTFSGTRQKLTLRGEVRLPELHIIGASTRTVITPSSDVIHEGRGEAEGKSSPLALDIRIRLILGAQVDVKVAGIDAELGGAMDLTLSSLDTITSRGEIRVIKGRYRTYGVNLEIVRGRLFFTGAPIDHPTLDFLALRTIGEVRAGVTVTGTFQKPVTKLYSEPAMPDVDVVAYIVLGHPLGSSGQQAGLLTQAAGALLTSGQAAVLQEQVKDYLGLSTLEIQGGVGGTKTPMGYKPLPVTAPGTTPAAQQAGITETVLTVGKYLTPQLYISYGKSLFTGNNLFRLRYDIFRKWQIETQTGGGESGADLYYKMEFK